MSDIPPPTNTGPNRHPLGRRFDCEFLLVPAILLTLFYGLPCLAVDGWRARRGGGR